MIHQKQDRKFKIDEQVLLKYNTENPDSTFFNKFINKIGVIKEYKGLTQSGINQYKIEILKKDGVINLLVSEKDLENI